MNKINELGTKSITRLIFIYSIPAALSLLINALYTLIDRAFVGHIPGEGSSALIAIGLSMPMISVITAISAYIAFGSLANISQSLGKGEHHKASRFVGNAISLSIVIGLAFTIIFFIFKPQIFHFLGVSNGIYPYIDQFLSILMGGAFISILGFVLPILVRANGGPLYSSMVILAGCLLNILLDWLFLFVFHWGIGGAAIATIISQAVTVILSIFHFVQGNSIIKLEKNNFALNFNIIHSISLIGLVPLTNNLSIGIAQVIMNFSLSHNGGEMYVGALATIVSIISLILMPIYGLNQGIMPILGYNFAQKSFKRVFQTLYLSVGYGFIFLTLGTVFIWICSGPMVNLFTKEAYLVQITTEGLEKYVSLLPMVAISTGIIGFLSLTGFPKFAAIINVLRQTIILYICVTLLPMWIGMSGLWLAQPITDFVTALICIGILLKLFGKKMVRNGVLMESKQS